MECITVGIVPAAVNHYPEPTLSGRLFIYLWQGIEKQILMSHLAFPIKAYGECQLIVLFRVK